MIVFVAVIDASPAAPLQQYQDIGELQMAIDLKILANFYATCIK